MLAKLELKINDNNMLSYQMASVFHGALMEMISSQYAEKLHESKLHPYSQHLEKENGEWYWVICTLNEEAKNEIIDEALLKTTSIHLSKKDIELEVVGKTYTERSDKEVARAFYERQSGRYIQIQFLTATAFKINGKYINYPDIRSVYSNLMNKYDASNETEYVNDEETLEELINNTEISRYELRSTLFSMEGVRIPAFIGNITLKIKGSQTMCNFARMLFEFGEYSGVGIKTALGMGAIAVSEERAKKNE